MTLRTISRTLLDDLADKAAASPRLRTNHNFHQPQDAVQRLIIQLAHGTYIRPHRHFELKKWEMALVIAGAVDIVLFDEQGTITDRIELSATGERMGIELPHEQWHGYVTKSPTASFFEIKEGPYDATRMAQFADWAPAEGDALVPKYLAWMASASLGARFTA